MHYEKLKKIKADKNKEERAKKSEKRLIGKEENNKP